MKSRTRNKIISLALAAVMLLSLLSGGVFAPVTANAAPAPGSIFYVGTSGQWLGNKTVYSKPQEAINAAKTWSDNNGNAAAYVLVAVGIYYTSDNSSDPFSLVDNVTVIGGFAGNESGIVPTYTQDGEVSNPNNTVFSGGNETRVFYNSGDRSAVLENAVIANGKTNESGGGMYNKSNSSPTLTNCTFTGNTAMLGGGMYNNSNSSPTLTNCAFTGNTAYVGGGMYNYSNSPTLTKCTFTGNTASDYRGGGGMYNNNSSPTLTNCAFTGNISTDYHGGGMCNSNSSPTLTNCTFTSNTAGDSGGGMYGDSSSPTLTNCTFTGNISSYRGGGMYNYSGSPTLTNCTFTGNTADSGGGVYNSGSNSAFVNCIVTLNTNGDVTIHSSTLTYKSSIIGENYCNDLNVTLLNSPPVAGDFNADGSLTENADYAIKNGNYSLYVDAISDLQTKLATAYPGVITSLDATEMRDINGNLVVSVTSGVKKIDIGAFRYIDTNEDSDKFDPPNPPDPVVSAVSGGAKYVSGTLTNGDVKITVSMGDISQLIKESAYYPFFPQPCVDSAALFYKLNSGNGTQYGTPLTVSASGVYEFYSKWGNKESDYVTFTVNIDTAKPTVVSVSPGGTGADISGNIVIKFNESMKTTAGVGNVSLSGGVATLNESGVWSTTTNTDDTYTIGYSGLTYGTTYTYGISGFQDAVGNVMDADSTNSFSTMANPYTLAWEGNPSPDSGFATLAYGYTSGSGVTYTIKNTGNQTVTGISASVSAGASNFQVSENPAASLAPGGTTTVTVTSKTGLNASATHYTDTLTVTWTNGEADITQSLSQTVNKAARTISEPQANTVTHNSVTLNAVTPSDGNGDGAVEYACNTTNTAPANGWQPGTIFSGLSAETPYYFFAYVAEGTNYLPATSTGTSITTSAVPVKTVDVGTQTGTLTAGTAGSVTFTVTTANITSGSAITLNTNGITGVTLDGSTGVHTGDTTVITINTTAETSAGNHPMTITIAGVTSGGFYLTVNPAVISEAAITGVTIPAYGGTPVTVITNTAQYTGTVSWSPLVSDTFAANTVYTATITLTPASGYTLTGVTADFFSVAGSSSVSNNVNSGVITAVFPQTGAAPDTVINTAAITGITAPVTGNAPVMTAPTGGTGYSCGTVTWSPTHNPFQGDTQYTATVTLTASSGYTFAGGLTTATINDNAATVTTNNGTMAMLSYEFAATESVTTIATVADVIVSGMTGTALTPQTATITIANDTVSADGLVTVDASGWFTGLPAGITATANGTGGGVYISVTFGGIPTETSTAEFNISIPGSVITGDSSIIVTANSNAKFNITAPRYTITFAANGGIVSPSSMQTNSDGKLTYLPYPTRTGNYAFDGWFTSDNGGTRITTGTVFTANSTVYAHWRYTGDSGSPNNSSSPDNSGNSDSYIPQTPAYKIVTIKDQNGRTIGSFDTTGSISGGVLSIKPNSQSNDYVFSFKLLLLKELESANKNGKFRITLPGLEYELPFDMANIITGLSDFLGNADLRNYTLNFTIKKLTGDDLTKAQEAFKKAYPNGEISGDFYDISFALYKNGSKTDFDANQFDSAVMFTLTTAKKCNSVFKYDEAAGRFRFVPAQFSDTKATAKTKTHSIYVAVKNRVAFSDVKASAWYEPYVVSAANKGLVEGYTGLFSPDTEVTRVEFVQMIVNAMQLPTAKADTKEYGDVTNKNVWYYNAVMRARSAGLLGGFSNADFKPNQAITREEMASVLAAVLRQINIPTTRQMIYLDQIFADYAGMDKKHITDIELVYRMGLMAGTGDGKFNPKGITTRAQAATVQIRLLEILGMIDIFTS